MTQKSIPLDRYSKEVFNGIIFVAYNSNYATPSVPKKMSQIFLDTMYLHTKNVSSKNNGGWKFVE
jgi:hypothetical protein